MITYDRMVISPDHTLKVVGPNSDLGIKFLHLPNFFTWGYFMQGRFAAIIFSTKKFFGGGVKDFLCNF
jgi:hypothetical protein